MGAGARMSSLDGQAHEGEAHLTSWIAIKCDQLWSSNGKIQQRQAANSNSRTEYVTHKVLVDCKSDKQMICSGSFVS
jgi:hypothetical protein